MNLFSQHKKVYPPSPTFAYRHSRASLISGQCITRAVELSSSQSTVGIVHHAVWWTMRCDVWSGVLHHVVRCQSVMNHVMWCIMSHAMYRATQCDVPCDVMHDVRCASCEVMHHMIHASCDMLHNVKRCIMSCDASCDLLHNTWCDVMHQIKWCIMQWDT